LVRRLVLKHLVHVFDAVDSDGSGDLRELQMVERLGPGALEEALVERPLRERNLEGSRFCGRGRSRAGERGQI
jgi:hypothetical protein